MPSLLGCTSKVALPVLGLATTLLVSLFARLLHIVDYVVGLLVSLMQNKSLHPATGCSVIEGEV